VLNQQNKMFKHVHKQIKFCLTPKLIYLFSKLHSKLKPNKLFCIYQ